MEIVYSDTCFIVEGILKMKWSRVFLSYPEKYARNGKFMPICMAQWTLSRN